MKSSPSKQIPLETRKRLAKALMESPIQFMSADELEGSLKLSEAEFLARLDKYIKDPEVDVPDDPATRPVIAGMLAKMYAKGLAPAIVKKYVPRAARLPPPLKPLPPATKKRKFAELRRKLNPTTPPRESS